jgi:hypothetical protein
MHWKLCFLNFAVLFLDLIIVVSNSHPHKFKNKTVLVSLMVTMKDDYECPWCGSNFEDSKELDLHARKHYEPPTM